MTVGILGRGETDEREWDLALTPCGENMLMQTTAWARRMERLSGSRASFVTVGAHGSAAARAVLFAEEDTGRPRVRWYGVPWTARGHEAEAEAGLLEAAERVGRAEGAEAVSWSRLPRTSASANVRAPWRSRRWASLRVPLARPEDESWSALSQGARKAVRKAREHGVVVARVETRAELADYYRFAEFAARQLGKPMHGLEDFTTMWDMLRGPAALEVFVARRDADVIAGLGAWGLGDVAEEWGSFRSPDPSLDGLRGGDLLKWEVSLWARDAGFRWFDLSGVHPSPAAGSKEEAIRRFKEKWGGEYYEYDGVGRPLSVRAVLKEFGRTALGVVGRGPRTA